MRIGLGSLALVTTTLLSNSAASKTELVISCARLEQGQAEELRARSRLLLGTLPAATQPKSTELVCDETSAWLKWFGLEEHLIQVDESAGIVEGALDALEAALERERFHGSHEVERTTREPTRGDDVPSFDEPSFGEAPAQSTPQQSETPGGLGLGVSAETLPMSLLAIGPRLDLGVGSGPFGGFMSESLRQVIGAEPDALLFDIQLGLSYGAPFAPQHRFGLIGAAGFEWFSASWPGARESRGQTDMSAILSAGVRSRWRLQSLALWLGLDLKGRLAPQRLGSPIELSLPNISAVISAGGLLLAAGSGG